MPYDCIWFDEIPDGPWEPGYTFPLGYELSKHYRCHVAKIRPAISVCLPTPEGRSTPFCIDSHPTDKPDEAWTVDCPWPLVVGEKPLITLSPSIHAVGIYHGFLTAGVLSDSSGA